MKKAIQFDEIGQALKFNEPVAPSHSFFTDFRGVRGEYQEKEIFRAFKVKKIDGSYVYNDKNVNNNTLLFLGGMRGSGKTTELAKYAQYLENKNAYFIITCNIDKELSLDDMEFMDILVFMMEKLTNKLAETKLEIDEEAIKSLKRWFESRVKEINNSIKAEAGIEVGLDTKGTVFQWLLGAFAKLKMGVNGSVERKESIRSTLKNNFSDFAKIFNNYILETERALRENDKGKKVLFIIDGLEKTWAPDTRRKIIIDEANKLQQINANIIYTLPIELMKHRQKIIQFSSGVVSFPYIKIIDRDGHENKEAIGKLKDFVLKRIDISLFEDEEMIKEAILLSGGCPRELLRILERTFFLTNEDSKYLESKALNKAAIKLANDTAQYIKPEEWEKIKEVKTNNSKKLDTSYDEVVESLLENLILMEYNDGTFKKINPILKLSNLYKQKIE